MKANTMSRTYHHNPELTAKYLTETSDTLSRYLHRLEDYRELDRVNVQLASATSLLDATGEHESPWSEEERAWMRGTLK
jgi:hypothetical protein